MLRKIVLSVLLALLLEIPAGAVRVFERTTVANLPTCASVTSGLAYFVTDGASTSDCSTGAGTDKNVCVCDGSSWVSLSAGGAAANSFETINTPSGTDPVADSSTDTLNITSGAAALTITGTSGTDTIDFDIAGTSSRCARFDGSGELVPASADCPSGMTGITFDIGDDGGNDSTALSEIATTNDNGSAITEPSADKMLIDVSKLRPPSILNPRASPASIDCEFDGNYCSGAWTMASGVSSGTVAPKTQQTSFYYDLTTWPGWMLVQGDNSSATVKTMTASHTPATNEMFVFHLFATGGVNATDEGRISVCYLNSGDSNEAVCLGFHVAGAVERWEIYVQNDGGVTAGANANSTYTPWQDFVFILFKEGNVYSAGIVSPYGAGHSSATTFEMANTVTKTGVTTFDQIGIRWASANEDPSPIGGIDFIRYYDSHTLAIMNP